MITVRQSRKTGTSLEEELYSLAVIEGRHFVVIGGFLSLLSRDVTSGF